MNPISSALPSARGELEESSLRRRMSAKLVEIETLLRASDRRDLLLPALSSWYQNFKRALRLQLEAEKAVEEFIPLLKELLIDPLTQRPLDEDAVLGSDGRTYQWRALELYRASAARELQGRSPLAPEDPAPLTTQPHPLVRNLAAWLKSLGENLSSPELDAAYESMQEERRNERIRQIRERSRRREPQAEIRSLLQREIEREFLPLHSRAAGSFRRQVSRLDRLEESDRERGAQLLREAERLEEEACRLEKEAKELEEELATTREGLEEAKRENLRLQQAVLEAKAAVSKARSSSLSALAGVIGIVSCCALFSLITPASLSASPLKSGAKVIFTTSL